MLPYLDKDKDKKKDGDKGKDKQKDGDKDKEKDREGDESKEETKEKGGEGEHCASTKGDVKKSQEDGAKADSLKGETGQAKADLHSNGDMNCGDDSSDVGVEGRSAAAKDDAEFASVADSETFHLREEVAALRSEVRHLTKLLEQHLGAASAQQSQ